MYVPEDNLLFRKLGLTRSISAELSMTAKEFKELLKSKVDQADYLFEFFAIRDKKYGGLIKTDTFKILHGGSDISGAFGSYHEKGDKLSVHLIVYSHMIYVFIFLFISYLIGIILIYNYDSPQKSPLIIISGISFLVFPAWILYTFVRKVKIAFIDFKKVFLNQ